MDLRWRLPGAGAISRVLCRYGGLAARWLLGFVVGGASCAKATQAGLEAYHVRALAIWDEACRLATQHGLRSDSC